MIPSTPGVPSPARSAVRTDPGARPDGAHTEHDAAAAVQHMFDEIAPTYDRANHLLSAGLDRLWWRRAARVFGPILARPDAQVLDLCCGTGDMTAALLELRPSAPETAPIVGLDFSAEMLVHARRKHAGERAIFVEGDAMHLQYAHGSVDLVTAAFGFRNLVNYAAGLAEIYRVLRPGGQFGILECNQPAGVTGFVYSLYFKRVLPVLGGLLSGRPSAYRYLPASVERFPRPPEMLSLIREAGFQQASWTGYTLGTTGLYRATKP
ncbi:MAG: bifunctional demethylmenaquinone methyltransferase/2-methoxy-6-polyprenyl-1,4-benzoquinol methylase UbiE [Acidobacteriaceae bacterium]